MLVLLREVWSGGQRAMMLLQKELVGSTTPMCSEMTEVSLMSMAMILG